MILRLTICINPSEYTKCFINDYDDMSSIDNLIKTQKKNIEKYNKKIYIPDTMEYWNKAIDDVDNMANQKKIKSCFALTRKQTDKLIPVLKITKVDSYLKLNKLISDKKYTSGGKNFAMFAKLASIKGKGSAKKFCGKIKSLNYKMHPKIIEACSIVSNFYADQ